MIARSGRAARAIALAVAPPLFACGVSCGRPREVQSIAKPRPPSPRAEPDAGTHDAGPAPLRPTLARGEWIARIESTLGGWSVERSLSREVSGERRLRIAEGVKGSADAGVICRRIIVELSAPADCELVRAGSPSSLARVSSMGEHELGDGEICTASEDSLELVCKTARRQVVYVAAFSSRPERDGG